jgi:hypothetical protein
MAALDVARPLIVRLDERRHPEDAAADLIEGWAAVETALRAMIGGSSLGGQALVSEVRAQGLLDYPHAHALLGFLAARDRATRPDYQPTAEDVAAARPASRRSRRPTGRGSRPTPACTGAWPATACCRPPAPPRAPPLPPAYAARDGRAGANGAPLAPTGRDTSWRDPHPHPAPPPAADVGPATGGRRRGLSPALVGGLLALLLLLGAGGYFAFGRTRAAGAGALEDGVTAFRAGRREAARAAFERAAAEAPALAIPRIYLGRLAREGRRRAARLGLPRHRHPARPVQRRGVPRDGAAPTPGEPAATGRELLPPRPPVERDGHRGQRLDGVRPGPHGPAGARRELLLARRSRRLDGVPARSSAGRGARGGGARRRPCRAGRGATRRWRPARGSRCDRSGGPGTCRGRQPVESAAPSGTYRGARDARPAATAAPARAR